MKKKKSRKKDTHQKTMKTKNNTSDADAIEHCLKKFEELNAQEQAIVFLKFSNGNKE